MQYPLAQNEHLRLKALHDYEILDTAPEAAFDDFTRLAAHICGTPIAMVSLVDEHRQWFKSKIGTEIQETPRDISFCTHAIQQSGLFIVPDATADPRFAESPLVTQDPHVRFYAGAPLITAEGQAVGSLCVVDQKPHALTPEQEEALQALSRQVITQMELRRELSAREKAERELRASEARKTAIFQSALDCIVTIDGSGRIVEWNPAAEETFGYPADDAIGEEIATLIIPPFLRDAHRQGFARYWKTGEGPVLGKRVEITAMRAGGEEFPVEMAITPVLLEGETLFTAYLRDITARQMAEEALRLAHEELEARVAARTAELSAVNAALKQEMADRKQAQENYRSLFENAVDGIFQVAPGGQYLNANPALARIYGYDSPDELVRSLTDVEGQLYVQPQRRSEFIDQMQRQGAISQFESEVYRKDKSVIWISETSRAILDDAGRLLRYEGTVKDITDRKSAEEALRESEARYQRIAANVPGMVYQCVISPDGQMTFPFVSEGCRDIYGLEPWEISRNPALIVDIIHPEDISSFVRSVGLTVTELIPWNWEGRIVTRDGRQKWVQGVARPERQPNGAVICEGLVRDVSERRNAQEALGESESRYRSLVEHSPEAIVVYSENRLVYANTAAATLFAAATPQDLLGRLIFDFVHPDHHALTLERARRSQEEGRPSGLAQQKYVRLDGAVIDVEAVSTSIMYQGRRAGQVLIRDVTERLRAERQIVALNSELRMAYDQTLTAYDETIEGWSRALDYRDHETEGHSRRVTDLTLHLARAIGMEEETLVHVRRGALLHDIGKMGVPDQILRKPGPLTDEEWSVMRRHPAWAREMLAPIAFLRPALDIPYCHHEKWDGSGYPGGLRGQDIPLAARLFAIVDVWDALRSDRPYRAAWPVERVIDHLQNLSGSHFDPEVVRSFLAIIEPTERREDLAMAA